MSIYTQFSAASTVALQSVVHVVGDNDLVEDVQLVLVDAYLEETVDKAFVPVKLT
jgi:hypothetical protein